MFKRRTSFYINIASTLRTANTREYEVKFQHFLHIRVHTADNKSDN